MTSESTPASRFQFLLADLLLLVVLDGVLCAFVLPYFYRGFVADPGLSYPSVGTFSNRVPLAVLTIGTAAFIAGVVLMMLIGHFLKSRRGFQISSSALIGLFAGAVAPAPWQGSDRVEERAAVDACKAYCKAQDIYRRMGYNKNVDLEYAQTFGGPIGLCGPNIKLLDHSFADAAWGEGHPPIPREGYVFKVLTGVFQGSSECNTLIASPAVYGGRTNPVRPFHCCR